MRLAACALLAAQLVGAEVRIGQDRLPGNTRYPHGVLPAPSPPADYGSSRTAARVPAYQTALLRELRINNRCALPVLFHEANDQAIAPGSTATFTRGVDFAATARISLMYEPPYINENIAVLELNGLFQNGFGQLSQRYNVNFIAQWGFIDLPLEVAFWADAERTKLACRDGRARCTYSARDCAAFTDGSARYEEFGQPGATYGFCRSLRGTNPTDPRACMGQYATYVNERCEVFDRELGTWSQSARSVGYRHMGWTNAVFWDGRVSNSTLTGRELDRPAVNFECWELPCIEDKSTCISSNQASVGNSGFAIVCDAAANGTILVSVLEVTACPVFRSAPTTTSGTPRTTATATPRTTATATPRTTATATARTTATATARTTATATPRTTATATPRTTATATRVTTATSTRRTTTVSKVSTATRTTSNTLQTTSPAAAPRQCQFAIRPVTPFYWEPACRMGMLGCLADGKHVECRFCGTGAWAGVPCPDVVQAS